VPSEITKDKGARAQRTIRTKRVITEGMDVRDAMERVDESKEDFLIFRNIETDRINVLVKKDQ